MGLISNGSTIFDNGAMSSGFGGNLNFISKGTASNSASLQFTGIDSTYDEYLFLINEMHPTSNVFPQFNFSTDNGSTYNVTKTSSTFSQSSGEAGEFAGLSYKNDQDLAQSTSAQQMSLEVYTGASSACSGYLRLFNPSSTTYVKHFIAATQSLHANYYIQNYYIGGYGNTTSAINAVKFEFASGNIETGEVILFGIS